MQHTGGAGGGIIELLAVEKVEINGEVSAKGLSPSGGRGGGGSGGSVFIRGDTIIGSGYIKVDGGSVTVGGEEKCPGGGGAGGRVAIHHAEDQNLFTGTVTAFGGHSNHECGGAGTVLFKDTTNDLNSLFIDNENRCTPLSNRINFADLDDLHKGEDSYRTYISDTSDSEHEHSFAELGLSGGAMLALYRRNIDTFDQTISVAKTSGDKSGTFHIGPQQVPFLFVENTKAEKNFIVSQLILSYICYLFCQSQ